MSNAHFRIQIEYLTTFLDAPTLEHSYIKLEQAIPCIMHCESCAGEQMLYMLILIGLDQRQTLAQHDSLIEQVNLLINNHVLGDDNDPYLYKIPYEDGELGDVKIHNWCMTKIMQHYGEFINCCLINDEEERAAWRVCHAKFDAVSVAI